MNNRLRYFLTIFLAVAGASTYVAYSRQQPVQNSTGSISGHLTSAKKPLSGIKVQLRGTPQSGDYPQRRIAAVVTDDNGYYQFTGVPDATYDVVPVTDRYFLADYTQNYEAGKTVTVSSGQHVVNVNFDMPMFGKIEGQIRDSNGRPVTQTSVGLTTSEKNREKTRFPAGGMIINPSDAQGNYSIEKVPPGSYIIFCGNQITYSMMATSDAEKYPIYPQTFHPGTADIAKASEVKVEPGATVTGVDITQEPPIKTYRITGRVIDEQTGAPVPKVGFRIIFQDSDDQKSEGSSGDWSSDSKGEFKIPVVLPGHIVIEPGPDIASNTYADPIEMEITDKDVTGLEIKMHRASTLSGQVVIDTSYGNAEIGRLSQLKYWAGLYLKDGVTRSTIKADIQPDGRFRFTALSPGAFKFVIYSTVKVSLNEFYLIRVERDGKELRDGIEIGKGEDLTGLRLIVRTTGAHGEPIRSQTKVKGGELERASR